MILGRRLICQFHSCARASNMSSVVPPSLQHTKDLTTAVVRTPCLMFYRRRNHPWCKLKAPSYFRRWRHLSLYYGTHWQPPTTCPVPTWIPATTLYRIPACQHLGRNHKIHGQQHPNRRFDPWFFQGVWHGSSPTFTEENWILWDQR